MDTSEPVQVECHSGHAYAQEPRAIVRPGGRLEVANILRRWRTPQGPVFRVLLSDGSVGNLAYDESRDQWSICLSGESDTAGAPPSG
jgi:hypothetical protein